MACCSLVVESARRYSIVTFWSLGLEMEEIRCPSGVCRIKDSGDVVW